MIKLTPALAKVLAFGLASGSFAAGGTRNAPLHANSKIDAPKPTFAENFIHAIRPPSHQGIAVSPISAQIALAMLGPGLGKQDLAKLDKVLGTAASLQYEDIATTLNAKGVSLANSVWLAPNSAVLPQYSQRLQSQFGADTHQLTSLGASGANQINQWVSSHTKGRIQKLLDSLPKQLVLSLVNTVVFDGKWQTPFPKNETATRTFHARSGDAQVPTMHGKLHIQLRHGSDYSLGVFPYKSSGLEMDVILPNPGSDPWKVLEEHRSSLLGTAPQPAATQQTDQVYLPKFNISTQLNLKPPMETLGLGSFFQELVNQKIANQNHLFISSAIQSVVVKVDEDGTTAAAATAIGVSATAVLMPPKNPIIFNVDRPFAFVIRDTETGQCLFVGAIYNPN